MSDGVWASLMSSARRVMRCVASTVGTVRGVYMGRGVRGSFVLSGLHLASGVIFGPQLVNC